MRKQATQLKRCKSLEQTLDQRGYTDAKQTCEKTKVLLILRESQIKTTKR